MGLGAWGLGLGVFGAFVLIGSPVGAQPLPVPSWIEAVNLQTPYETGLLVGASLAAIRLHAPRPHIRMSVQELNQWALRMRADLSYLRRLIRGVLADARTHHSGNRNYLASFAMGVGLRTTGYGALSNSSLIPQVGRAYTIDSEFVNEGEFLSPNALDQLEFFSQFEGFDADLAPMDEARSRFQVFFASIDGLILDRAVTDGVPSGGLNGRHFWREALNRRFPNLEDLGSVVGRGGMPFPGGLEAFFRADAEIRSRWLSNPTPELNIITLFTPRPSPARVSEPTGPAEPPRISFEPGRTSVVNDPEVLEEAARAAAAREPAPPPVIDASRAVPNAAESIVVNGNDGDTMHREPPSSESSEPSEPSDMDIPEDAWRSVYDRHGYDFLRNFFGNRPWFVRVVTRVCNAALTPSEPSAESGGE